MLLDYTVYPTCNLFATHLHPLCRGLSAAASPQLRLPNGYCVLFFFQYSTTEIYNITFDNTVLAAVGDQVVYTLQSAGVAHEVAIGKVLRNVVDKNTVIVELQPANPNQLTTTDIDGNTVTIPSTSYVDLGFFDVGFGCQINTGAATIVNVRSLSKGFKLLDIEDNIAVT